MRRATRIGTSPPAGVSPRGRRRNGRGSASSPGAAMWLPRSTAARTLLVTGEVTRLPGPICRAEIERMRAAGRGRARLLDHLAAAGPSSTGDLRTELGLTRQELTALRAPLERCGA